MSIYIEIYKIKPKKYTRDGSDADDQYCIEKFQTTAFDNLQVDLNTPISPMPLPEDDAEGNILVKMEGNSKQIRVSFKFDSNITTLQHVTGFDEDQLAYSGDLPDVDYAEEVISGLTDGNKKWTYTNRTETNNLKLLKAFLYHFESRSITDLFLFRLVDSSVTITPTSNHVIMESLGSISSISSSVDSASPVVWNCNIDFLVGDVISIYDSDTPDEVENFTIAAGDNSLATGGDSNTKKKIIFKWSNPTRTGGSALTKFHLTWIDDENGEHDGMTITYTEANTSTDTMSKSGSLYSKIITNGDGIAGEKNYTCRMKAANTGGRGIVSDEVGVETPAD